MILPNEIESALSPDERYNQGIFFTSNSVVKEIVAEFNWDKIETVIDSAAGSCNFLLELANKFPTKRFYGVEKNLEIFTAMQPIIEKTPNLQLFYGDILLDFFDIPKCDLYLGNPPFINFSDLEDDYRSKLIPIWKNSFKVDSGFRMMLGQSRGDIAQLIFYFTIRKYLKRDASFGVVLPDSLLFGNSASSGFREFKNIGVDKVVDLSHRDPFLHTSRSCFYIIGKSNKETVFPISFEKEHDVVRLYKHGDKLLTSDKKSSGENSYIARQGVNTLGANAIFFFKKNPPFKSTLIKPLLKSSDIKMWESENSYTVLFPYDSNGQLYTEAQLKNICIDSYNYLLEHKEKLLLRKSKLLKSNWFALFGVGSYTTAEYKVVWRALGASKFEASVVKDSIPNQAMHGYIGLDSEDEAHFVCSVMNSSCFTKEVDRFSKAGSKSYALPSIINQIFIPKYQVENKLHEEIVSFSKLFHNLEYVNELIWQKKVEDLLKKG